MYIYANICFIYHIYIHTYVMRREEGGLWVSVPWPVEVKGYPCGADSLFLPLHGISGIELSFLGLQGSACTC